jgi:hypothetical protein
LKRLLVLTGALAALGTSASAAWAAGLHVIPFPGTPDAAPATQLIFSALRPAEIRSVQVIGSHSGRHRGHLSPLPAGAGTAFVPDRPFLPGERVRVHAGLASAAAGAAMGAPGSTTLRFAFTVGQAASLRSRTVTRTRAAPGRKSDAYPTLKFHSAPSLHPPAYTATGNPDQSSGDIFLSPTGSSSAGGMILDSHSQLVWYGQLKYGQAVNLGVQHYRGHPVLTWFHGTIFGGKDVIMSRAYRKVAVVRAGNGYAADLHEFRITPRGTALIDAYVPVHRNLQAIGGPKHGTVFDCVIQELDIRTGRVLWEWHALGHVPLGDSYADVPNKLGIYDYFHLNSIQQLPGGNLLISARNTWGIYEIDRRTGRVIWTLGGKHSDFRPGHGTRFEWQHDARLHAHGILTLFDDADTPQEEPESSAKALRINTATMRVSLVQRYTHSPPILAAFGGGAQVLPNHNVFVSWGSSPQFSEFTSRGKQIFTASFVFGVGSYRAFRFRWVGQPRTKPSLAVSSASGGGVTLYASWNGATEVVAWRVLGGASQSSLTPVLRATRKDFETAIAVASSRPYFEVQALDARGRVLGTSRAQAS